MIFDGGIPVTSRQCMNCHRFIGAASGVDTGTCGAFAAIPVEIWVGAFDHSKPYAGDRGLRFDPIQKESLAA